MKKIITFSERDRELIKKIEKYQHAKELSSFVAAVRQLCEDALALKKISK